MGSPKGSIDEVSEAEASDWTFPAADGDSELNPDQKNKDFEVDRPVSSDMVTSSEIKKQVEGEEAKESKKKGSFQTLKTTIIISAVIVAVAGVAFAVTKKLREK